MDDLLRCPRCKARCFPTHEQTSPVLQTSGRPQHPSRRGELPQNTRHRSSSALALSPPGAGVFCLALGGRFFPAVQSFQKFFVVFFLLFFLQHLHSGTGSTPGCWPCSRGAAHKKAPKGIKEHRSPNHRSRPVTWSQQGTRTHVPRCPRLLNQQNPHLVLFFFSPSSSQHRMAPIVSCAARSAGCFATLISTPAKNPTR